MFDAPIIGTPLSSVYDSMINNKQLIIDGLVIENKQLKQKLEEQCKNDEMLKNESSIIKSKQQIKII